MKIAIIAWGSLVWAPKNLPVSRNWQVGGPVLPVEFSRVSKDARLTLVIDKEHGVDIKTHFAISSRTDLSDAIADLRDREGTIRKKIGYVDLLNKKNSKAEFSDHVDIFDTIENWCNTKKFDAAIWTALSSQFEKETNMEFSLDNALIYLRGLPSSASKNAFEYIQKAPKETDTPLRKKLEKLNYKV